ncbi:MAG: thiol peroxidase [Candidatus Dadabacteria bacterium]|nr:MAG: thiol peroxidase [Candidatus Dadabacteria bacterium]
MAQVTLRGNPCNLKGSMPQPGQTAPDFRLVRADLSEVTLGSLGAKKKVIVTVPSLDTPVCQTETRKFNERASQLEGVEVLVVSSDLPFAQKRFCETEGIERVTACSDVRDRGFGERYGVAIADGPLEGVLARAVFVLDENNQVKHAQLVPEIGQEPDYDAALAALS